MEAIETERALMDVTNALEKATVEATLFEWLAVHGNLCLALRHPQNDGPSRAAVATVIHRIGRLIVERGILTAEELNYATRIEHDQYGLERIV